MKPRNSSPTRTGQPRSHGGQGPSRAPTAFYRRAQEALSDAALSRTVQLVTSRVQGAREVALRDLAEADALRDHARRVRAHTLARLDHYLDQFAAAVESRGGRVFYAHTAAEAVQYVRELARVRGLRLAVKSKSMISEEVDLNRHLQGDGVRVVETDLGEFIVQLADDRPSHIVMPILHKTRGDVARLFQEKLGATDEDVSDVPHMTAFARRILRSEFLNADLGVSGVNFGVAATGSLCICTNEGNGRLTTTLPRVHVAMMGIERIVPGVEDLAVMLQLLARSATGQKLTVYTNIITGPRRADGADREPDGPEELHVVLVDNGRSRVLGSDFAEILYCIRCGACLNVCPVYQQVGGHAYGSVYPGPVGSVLTPGLFGIEAFPDLPHASSLCGACREVCPVRIEIPRMLLGLRHSGVGAGAEPWWLASGIRLFRWMAERPRVFGLAGRLAARATQLLGREGWIARMPGPLSAWTRSRDFPVMAPDSFQDRWRQRTARKGA